MIEHFGKFAINDQTYRESKRLVNNLMQKFFTHPPIIGVDPVVLGGMSLSRSIVNMFSTIAQSNPQLGIDWLRSIVMQFNSDMENMGPNIRLLLGAEDLKTGQIGLDTETLIPKKKPESEGGDSDSGQHDKDSPWNGKALS